MGYMFKLTECSSNIKALFFIKKEKLNISWESEVAAEGMTREVETSWGEEFFPGS